jgi:3',5'-cyclic AMP phosphodiesterase CpdA
LSFRIAQFSDVHLGPLPLQWGFGNFALKRLIGTVSWQVRRKGLHDPLIAEQLRGSILQAAPDYTVCSGDMVNIAAYQEFDRARDYLAGFGAPDGLSLAPGNHDAYVPVNDALGFGKLSPWTSGDMRRAVDAEAAPYPAIRLRRNIAIITLNSAIPQSLFSAAGIIGELQLQSLALMLDDLRNRGFYRLVNLHHCPLPGIVKDRKALVDAALLQQVLEQHGAELVVYGHTHKYRGDILASSTGDIPIIGVASASSNGSGNHQAAQWHMFEIDREKRAWVTTLQSHNWNGTEFMPGAKIPLSLAA